MRDTGPAPRLDVLKALGDNTRYAIYLELARSPLPLTTAEVADILRLHPNTVRPHLERMREVGLLVVEAGSRGGVGRPQHRYSLSPDAPALGLEPSPLPTLTRMLVRVAADAGIVRDEVIDAGRQQGRLDAARWPAATDLLEVLAGEQARMGFDPEVVEDDSGASIAFAHCPFRDLAVEHPDLICGLHCGMVEGMVEQRGGARVERFASLVDRDPCRVDLTRPPHSNASAGVGSPVGR